ncbi:DUF5683 domain-containing protein [Niabella soli]|nr:DUF5683 domain-containing protein [Niabella soli]
MLLPNKKLLLLLLLFCFDGIIAAQTTASIGLIREEQSDAFSIRQQLPLSGDKWKTDASYSDSVAEKRQRYRDPGKAAFRSAALPGWGQVYNRRIWKVPVIYAGLGITAGLFVDNLKWFKRFQYACSVADNIQNKKDSLSGPNFAKVYKTLKAPFFTDNGIDLAGLKSYRGQSRQYMDNSLAGFLLVWVLNVVDATVDAHLSSFDVSPGLSLKISPSLLNENNIGMSLAVQLK